MTDTCFICKSQLLRHTTFRNCVQSVDAVVCPRCQIPGNLSTTLVLWEFFLDVRYSITPLMEEFRELAIIDMRRTLSTRDYLGDNTNVFCVMTDFQGQAPYAWAKDAITRIFGGYVL